MDKKENVSRRNLITDHEKERLKEKIDEKLMRAE